MSGRAGRQQRRRNYGTQHPAQVLAHGDMLGPRPSTGIPATAASTAAGAPWLRPGGGGALVLVGALCDVRDVSADALGRVAGVSAHALRGVGRAVGDVLRRRCYLMRSLRGGVGGALRDSLG